MLPSAGDDDGISRLVQNTGSSKRDERWNQELGEGGRQEWREREKEREIELLGGFHRVRTRRGAPTKVCISQHGTGDVSCSFRQDGYQESVFLSSFFSLIHSRYHTNTLMSIKSTSCHTCIQGKSSPHADSVNSFLSLSVCYLSVCVSISSDF